VAALGECPATIGQPDDAVGPLVNLVGRRLRDRTPKAWSWPLQLGLVTSGVLVLASVPVLVGVGRRTQPGTASVLPGHYPLALAGVLTVVWLDSGECFAPGGNPSGW
jgi:hypothetical protein